MKKFLRILGIIVVLAGAFLVIMKTTTRFTSAQPATAPANPASVYCQQQSGTLEMVTDASGAQSGICHLTDGTTCEEWAYFRGECPTTGKIVKLGENLSIETTDPKEYILIQRANDGVLNIDIYKKSDVSKIINTIVLPEGESYDNPIPDQMRTFNSKGIYYEVTVDRSNDKKSLFKIPLNGTIEKIDLGSGFNEISDGIIDQETLQMAYITNDNKKLAVYDINTQSIKLLSYDPTKRKNTKYPANDFTIVIISSFKDGIIHFTVDHDGVDTSTEDSLDTCVDTNKNIELSADECKKTLPNNSISYKSNDSDPMYGDPTLVISGKDIGIFPGISFSDIIGEYILGWTIGESEYKFYKLQDILNNKLK